MIRKMLEVFFALFVLTTASGCVWNEEVPPNEMAIILYKGEVDSVSGPGGLANDGRWWTDLIRMNVDTLTFTVEDPSILTKDNQSVSMAITVQARRKIDTESVKNIFTRWNSLLDNANLTDTISRTAREGMKNGVRGFTLATLLDDRDKLATDVKDAIQTDADEYSVEIVNVTIENVGPSDSYMAILGETANINAKIAQSVRQEELIRQQQKQEVLEQQKRVEVANARLLAEQAETAVQVEVAERQGEITAAQNQVYVLNEQAYRLEELRLLANIIGTGTVYFIPEGTDLTTYFFPNGAVFTPPVPR
jgi:uncharacterized membrane protein YqiK